MQNLKSQSGSVILPFIVTLPFLILIATYFMNLSVTSFKLAVRDHHHTKAQFAVDGAIDLALQQINIDEDWSGSGGEVETFNDGKVRTTYEVEINDVDDDNKTVSAVGRTYRPANSPTPESSVRVDADIRALTSGGTYSLVTGVGGLYMSNSAKIVGGDVFVNGEVSLSNTAQIGLSTNPLDVTVAHQNCPEPPNATYPRVCNNGENGEPISISHSAHIYGDVKANNQVDGSDMSDPGLTASSGVTPGSLPAHDRNAQKAAAVNNLTGAAASCSGSQTRTWAANTKITGNVTVSNNCVVTVMGDVWITGTFETRNSSRVVVSNSLGATRPTIMVDGSIAHFRNSSILQSNSSNTGFQIITYRSSPSCSPDCADVTGQDLYNSRNLTTISLEQSASGPHTIFYARWTRVTLDNSGSIGALVGQTVELRNSGTITFGTSVSGVGAESAWIIDGYRRVYE